MLHFRKKQQAKKHKKVKEQMLALTLETLLQGIRVTFNEVLRANVYESGFTRKEIEERILSKKLLRQALRDCVHADKASKVYVKNYIKDIITKRYGIGPDNIDLVIPFTNPGLLTAEDKFDIILYIYRKDYDNKGLDYLIQEYQLDKAKESTNGDFIYEINEEDIHQVYDACPVLYLTFHDKLCIVIQRLYQLYKGNGAIDELRDMKIDGISAGVSGICKDLELDNPATLKELPAAYDSIWIFYRGKTIHLSFLSFHSEKELIRVCKNIYRYDNPGQLSEVKGYTVNEMRDGSRVSVARPPFCESWVLFIRKFDSVLQQDIHQLITDDNKELPINFMKWLIKGCQVTAITGEQGSGKTTLLMSLIQFINPTYNLRIQELSFELHLRKIYPSRNIVTFRETNSISGQEGLDFQKKTDGTVNILGEVASAPICNWLVQMSQVASLFTLFTHHAKTTRNLIIAMRNALLLEGGFHNERIATEQAVDAINFDIHMKKTVEGHRYIERITQIIPYHENHIPNLDASARVLEHGDLTHCLFETRELISYKEGKYVVSNYLHPITITSITCQLNEEERIKFIEFLTKNHLLGEGDRSLEVSTSE